ncbi:hypothetical protein BH23PLA1_BH23PLA1_29500 [soil metagenome]
MSEPAGPRNPNKAEQAALLLAQGHSLAASARLVGAGERTVKRWNKNPKFRARVDEHRRALVDATVGRLVESSTNAVNVLAELMESADSDSTRLGAAKAILDKLPGMADQQKLLGLDETDKVLTAEQVVSLLSKVSAELPPEAREPFLSRLEMLVNEF